MKRSFLSALLITGLLSVALDSALPPVSAQMTPVGSTSVAAGGGVLASLNLSDLPSPATARVNLGLGNVLTAGTMTVENANNVKTSISSYTWTNAMVVALGAVLAGDIKVATLPAKTVVENAYVVITGPGAGPLTLTVACGRTGPLYIDYIKAADATVAAGTLFGAVAGDRGTNLVGFDLPSYSGTTDLYCHFLGTVSNLSQVTGSTGRVILTTTLLP